MRQPLQPADDAAAIRAIEENAAEFLLALGRAGGGEERREGGVHWTIGGSPIDYHNVVVRANLAPGEADRAIRASIERLAAHNVPGTWHVGPSMRPLDLGERLLAHGFTGGEPEPGMAADLHALREDLPAPDGLAIERVRDEAGLADWVRTLAVDFGEGEREASWVGEMYRRVGLGDEAPMRHYVGRLDGAPVATASVFLGGGAAGIYFVATVPWARRRGIGAAITLAALRDARALGYRLGVLGASEPGYPVYARLGFTERCSIRVYTWEPA